MTLEELINPITESQFYDEYWEKRPLMIAGERERFSHLFSSRQMTRLLRYSRPRAPKEMMLAKGGHLWDGDWMQRDGTPRIEKVRAAWGDGYSIIVNGLNKLWEPVAGFAASLHEDLHHPVNVNMYFTPAGSQAIVPHFDIMDVFILQLEGSKIWRVHEPARYLPLPDEQADIPQDNVPRLIMEEELNEGSVLYIPRGHAHAARATSAASLHLTVGAQVVTWIDLFSAAVSAARNDERFRKALPPGFLNGSAQLNDGFRVLLDELPQHLSLQEALVYLAEQLIEKNHGLPGDELLTEDANLDSDTIVARRKGMICRIVERRNYAAIQYCGGKIIGPEKIAPALKHICENRSFAVGCLPGSLNEREKIVLVRRLIREGLLEVKT